LTQSKLIMFDFDGVIVDSLDHQCRAFVETVRAEGFADLATAEQFLEFTESNWFEALAAAGVPPTVVSEVENAFGAAPSPELFPEMATVIERLAAAHRMIVITSSRTDVVERVLAEHSVRGVAEVIGGDQDESKTRKIDNARRRFGRALAAWYVGDTVGDILEARRAGVGTIGVAWGWHGVERLRRANPDHMAHAPSDLLDLF
jgi:phosphoglycolate phosphatase